MENTQKEPQSAKKVLSDSSESRHTFFGKIGAVWGLVGVSLILGRGLYCLYPFAKEICVMRLNWVHWSALAVSVVFMGYAEGYRGFHRRFAPRTAARARYLLNHPTPLRVVLAPFFCMSFFHASRKRRMVTYCLTAGIIALIAGVSKLIQPWRGIVDAGVLIGLGWGLFSVWFFTIRMLCGTFEESPNCSIE